jgi:hypothetical protein
LGLADADFDRITDSLFVHEGVIYSETHDFDLDCACTDVLPRYLAEVAHTDKCETLGGAVGVRTFIFDALKPISVLRFVNHHQKLRYRLSRIRHHVVAPDTVVDIDVLVDNVSTGAFDSTGQKQTLKNLILAQAKCEFDARQLTNGHDFLTMLGVAL